MKTMNLINGVDLDQLRQNIAAIQDNPGIATFRFRATNRWDDGGHNRTTIHDFYGAGQTVAHHHDFRLDADEPELLLGKDKAANPAEYLLTALAGCLTTSMVYHAAARGITIRAVESELEGELDLRGFLGLSDRVRNGYQNITVRFRIDADASQTAIDELVELAKARSPVFDMLTHPVDVHVTGERLQRGRPH